MSFVLCLVLQSISTHVNGVVESCGVFCNRSEDVYLGQMRQNAGAKIRNWSAILQLNVICTLIKHALSTNQSARLYGNFIIKQHKKGASGAYSPEGKYQFDLLLASGS